MQAIFTAKISRIQGLFKCHILVIVDLGESGSKGDGAWCSWDVKSAGGSLPEIGWQRSFENLAHLSGGSGG